MNRARHSLMKLRVSMYLDNLLNPAEFQGHGSRSHRFFVLFWNQLGRIHEMLHKHGPRAVLSLEQGSTFLLFIGDDVAWLVGTIVVRQNCD